MPGRQSLQQFKAEYFKALGHPTRLRILELLRAGELTVGELQERLGVDASAVSQQLAVLRAHRIVEGRRLGTAVSYSIREPAVFQLLAVAREIFQHHLADMQAIAASEPEPTGDDGSVGLS